MSWQRCVEAGAARVQGDELVVLGVTGSGRYVDRRRQPSR
jgi:hypothetical protein